jgi:hypothetical protein
LLKADAAFQPKAAPLKLTGGEGAGGEGEAAVALSPWQFPPKVFGTASEEELAARKKGLQEFVEAVAQVRDTLTALQH